MKTARETAASLVLPVGYRETIYLHPLRVTRAFRSEIGSVRSFVQSVEEHGEAGGELNAWLVKVAGKAGEQRGLSLEFEVDDPYVMALLLFGALEKAARLADPCDLLDPSAYYHVMGSSRVFHPDISALPEHLPGAEEVEEERVRQENLLRWGDDSANAASMLFAAPCPVALILSRRYLDNEALGSYMAGTYGVLGRYESDVGNVRFLAPMYVWWSAPPA